MTFSGVYSLNQYWISERGARIARRDDREYREYLRESQCHRGDIQHHEDRGKVAAPHGCEAAAQWCRGAREGVWSGSPLVSNTVASSTSSRITTTVAISSCAFR